MFASPYPIPAHRIDDVVLFDPSDHEFPVGFNILSAHTELEKILLASDLSSVFQRLSTSWGDQMHSVLTNAILAFLESKEGGTLADLRRFLVDPAFREKHLRSVTDAEVVYYWRKSFPLLGGNKSLGPLMTRLETFLGPKPIRYIVSQKENRLDFGDIMDSGKIFLAKLSQGEIGKKNSHLLGSLLMAKFQEQAMSRQAVALAERRPFWLYVDEFPNFISSSMAEILAGARKYNLGLVLAHQELRQLQAEPDLAAAVLSNAGTRIVFRVGDADAKVLAEGFSDFDADGLRRLGKGEAISRIERSDWDFNLTVPFLDKDNIASGKRTRDEVIRSSRAKYATPRSEVEKTLAPQQVTSVETVAEPAETELAETLPREPNVTPVIVPSVPVESPPAPKSTIAPPADLGRGGAQHQSIQHKLKAAAEELGFRAVIEKPILDGQGSIDLALEKENFAIACEITVTTTTDHEFGNVKKCLRAGYTRVAVVSPRAERLRQIEEAVKAALTASESECVGYFSPDTFITWLRSFVSSIPTPEPALPAEHTCRGYKVRCNAAKLSEEERKAKEEIALKAIAETMKKRKV